MYKIQRNLKTQWVSGEDVTQEKTLQVYVRYREERRQFENNNNVDDKDRKRLCGMDGLNGESVGSDLRVGRGRELRKGDTGNKRKQ